MMKVGGTKRLAAGRGATQDPFQPEGGRIPCLAGCMSTLIISQVNVNSSDCELSDSIGRNLHSQEIQAAQVVA
jgi:hypothetical protein